MPAASCQLPKIAWALFLKFELKMINVVIKYFLLDCRYLWVQQGLGTCLTLMPCAAKNADFVKTLIDKQKQKLAEIAKSAK